MTTALASLASALPGSWSTHADGEAAHPHEWIMAVVNQEAEGLTRMLRRLLGNDADVLDAFQDTFCKLAQRGEHVDLRSTRAYVYRTAVNVGIELIRARKRRLRHWDAIVSEHARAAHDDEAESSEPETTIDDDRLREAIGLLPPHLRGVIVLRDLGRMAYEEVGRILAIDPATARVYRRHAIVRLAELMGGASDPC